MGHEAAVNLPAETINPVFREEEGKFLFDLCNLSVAAENIVSGEKAPYFLPDSGHFSAGHIVDMELMLYGTYIWLIFECLFDIPLLKNKRKQAAGYSLIKSVAYFSVAVVFFLMEVTGNKVGVYSVVRGFIVICGIEMGIENIYWWVKNRAR